MASGCSACISRDRRPATAPDKSALIRQVTLAGPKKPSSAGCSGIPLTCAAADRSTSPAAAAYRSSPNEVIALIPLKLPTPAGQDGSVGGADFDSVTEVSIEELEVAAAGSWQAPEQEWLGGWRLGAAAGFTGRANSALPAGDPGPALGAAGGGGWRW